MAQVGLDVMAGRYDDSEGRRNEEAAEEGRVVIDIDEAGEVVLRIDPGQGNDKGNDKRETIRIRTFLSPRRTRPSLGGCEPVR